MQGGRAAGGMGGHRLLLDLPPGHGVGAGLGGPKRGSLVSAMGDRKCNADFTELFFSVLGGPLSPSAGEQ